MTFARPRPGDDSGASLIFALIFITVISVVIAVMLSFTDSSLRSTVALRNQSWESASADGAAQIAINALRRGSFSGAAGQCFGASGTLALPNFYQPAQGPADSAAVVCSADPTLGAVSTVGISPSNRPANALLTVGSSGGESGISSNDASGRDVKVKGPIFSNSTIDVASGGLVSTTIVTARGACTGSVIGNPPARCAIGAGPAPDGNDPLYPPPPAGPGPGPPPPPTVQSVPICDGKPNHLFTFTPGIYTGITDLNNIQRCANAVLWFQPGTYYFDLPAGEPWTINDDYLVGGAPTTPLVGGTRPTMPGSCVSPVPPTPIGSWTPPPANSGVQFIFGGGSQFVLHNTSVELCGSWNPGLPMTIYGLRSAAGSVPAQSGCTIATPPATRCATITLENQPNNRFYIQGTTYLPNAALDIALSNPTGLAFADGLIARTVTLTPTATAGLATPVIGVPDYVPIGQRTVVYLLVYVCPGLSSCTPATGRIRLRAKVALFDPTGVAVPGRREITVYSWSVQR